MYEDLIEKVNSLPSFGTYKNRTPIIQMNSIDLTMEDVVKAGIISGLNIFLIGERGEGKTQLMSDASNNYFEGRATYMRARPDSDPREIYEKYNIKKVAEGFDIQHTQTDLIRRPLTLIDEINRAPPVIQNQFFHMCDGYIDFENKKTYLGAPSENGDNYHIVIASANVGNGRYIGTFDMDPALTDRFGLILNVDTYPTECVDDIEIFLGEGAPKVLDSEKGNHINDIVEVNSKLDSLEEDPSAYVALEYLRRGLDYCVPERSQDTLSKRAISYAIPNICDGCNRLGDGCGYIRPISVRTAKTIKRLAKGLNLVSSAKAGSKVKPTDYVHIYETFKVVGPYSQILEEHYVHEKWNSNPNLAINHLADKFKQELKDKEEFMGHTLLKASKGNTDAGDLDKFTNDWSFYGKILNEVNNIAHSYGDLATLDKDKLKKACEENPILKIFL